MFLHIAKRNTSSLSLTNTSQFIRGKSHRFEAISYKDKQIAPYKTLRGNQEVFIHPSSVFFSQQHKSNGGSGRGGRGSGSGSQLPEYIVFSELLITSKVYMRNITAINSSWLMEVVPSHVIKGIQAVEETPSRAR